MVINVFETFLKKLYSRVEKIKLYVIIMTGIYLKKKYTVVIIYFS